MRQSRLAPGWPADFRTSGRRRLLGVRARKLWRLGVSLLSPDITIWDIYYHQVSELLKVLADRGLVANRDFEFSYYPAFANYERGLSNRRSAVFRFTDDANATWFALRYG
jgi:hypothetical protein